MIIHTDAVTSAAIYNATDYATREGGQAQGRTVRPTRLELRGSRSRSRAFDVILTGNNTRRQNGGEDQAATYDEWGHFLAFLFDVDPSMITPYYNGREDFHAKTANVYKVGATL